MQSTVMENYQLGMANHSSSGIERMINFSMPYNHLEMQLNQNHLFQEPEDRPETFHTPWGVWLHWRDALHHIDQTYDAKHVVRTGMVAEDILHYAHYVPVIGDHEHAAESYEMKFEYDYSHEFSIYNAEIHLGKEIEELENTEVINIFADAVEDEPPDAETESEEPGAPNGDDKGSIGRNNEIQESDLSLQFEKQLTRIFEQLYLKNFNDWHK